MRVATAPHGTCRANPLLVTGVAERSRGRVTLGLRCCGAATSVGGTVAGEPGESLPNLSSESM